MPHKKSFNNVIALWIIILH